MTLADDLKFPGDKIGSIEEYVPGRNTYDDGESIRATVIGSSELDNSEKTVNVITQRRVHNNVECICQTRHLRKKYSALVQDVVIVKIIARQNGTIHGTIDDKNLGVLSTKCRKCFGIVGIMRDAVKCKECGWIDDRKLSSDFGKMDIIPSEKR